jgi:hypothetical protein
VLDGGLHQSFQIGLGRQIDEFDEDPFAPGMLPCTALAFALIAIRKPRGCERCESTDSRAGQGGDCCNIGWIHDRAPQLQLAGRVASHGEWIARPAADGLP